MAWPEPATKGLGVAILSFAFSTNQGSCCYSQVSITVFIRLISAYNTPVTAYRLHICIVHDNKSILDTNTLLDIWRFKIAETMSP